MQRIGIYIPNGNPLAQEIVDRVKASGLRPVLRSPRQFGPGCREAFDAVIVCQCGNERDAIIAAYEDVAAFDCIADNGEVELNPINQEACEVFTRQFARSEQEVSPETGKTAPVVPPSRPALVEEAAKAEGAEKPPRRTSAKPTTSAKSE